MDPHRSAAILDPAIEPVVEGADRGQTWHDSMLPGRTISAMLEMLDHVLLPALGVVEDAA